MFRVVAAIVSALALSSGAFAQSATPFDWNGVYIGANGGYGWGTDDSVDFNYTGLIGCPGPGCPSSLSLDAEGFIGGGHGGIDWQSPSHMWMFGIEGDIDWSDIDGSHSILSAANTVRAATDLEWLGTLRGRGGVTLDRLLFYGTGGVAFGGVENSASLTNISLTVIPGGGAVYSGSDNDTEVGWVAGGGIEFAATEHLLLGAEALFVDLGDNSVNIGTVPPLTAAQSIRADFENEFLIARGRASFKW